MDSAATPAKEGGLWRKAGRAAVQCARGGMKLGCEAGRRG